MARAMKRKTLRAKWLGNFRKCGLDRIFYGADLGGYIKSGIFDHLFAHGCSFPGVPHAGVAVGLIWSRSAV